MTRLDISPKCLLCLLELGRPYWGYYRGGGFGWGYWDPWMGGPFWHNTVDVQTVEAFEATAEIIMNKGPIPMDEPSAMDARAVLGPRRLSCLVRDESQTALDPRRANRF